MPPFFCSPAPAWMHPENAVEIEIAIAGYLAISRSPLRFSEPAWFDLAEEAEWERACAATGIRRDRHPGRAECAKG